jgi:hypothetical protein
MNDRTIELFRQATEFAYTTIGSEHSATPYFQGTVTGKFAELIVEEHLRLLQQEWYDLNNAPAVENESPRDVGIRVGRKGEVITLMHKIKEHFGVTE